MKSAGWFLEYSRAYKISADATVKNTIMNASVNFNYNNGVDILKSASHYVSQIGFVHVLSLGILAFVADYAWMLYMRRRMVSTSGLPLLAILSINPLIASGTMAVANYW
jgi:hypothetical protein